MHDFILHIPTKFVFGNNVFQRSGNEIRKIALKVLIVCSSGSAVKNGYLDTLLNLLEEAGVRADVYDKVMPNPRVSMIDAGGRLAQNLNVDAIIGLGGGSAMDAAKGVAMVAKHGGSIWDYTIKHKTLHSSLPVICIPTLSATGSEGNAYGVITHDETLDKNAFVCASTKPVLSIIDPQLTTLVPMDYLLDGAVDIITHATEAYFTSTEDAIFNDKLSLSLTESVIEALARILKNPDDVDARATLAWVSTVALIGINEAGREGPHSIHVIEHALSGMFDISHGRGLAMLFPKYLTMFKDVVANKLIPFGKIFDPEVDSADSAITAFTAWLKNINRDLMFDDFNIPADAIPALADSVLRTSGNKNNQIGAPRAMDKKDIETLYRMCVRN
ncbi:MAG: iron-containing alcohol dehydrogenase [Candidatus Marinimicrobia bacterium]|nr:iron-containing alcohol dehydrogenase [Candidatus Neomarinimicrobiota bacterium]